LLTCSLGGLQEGLAVELANGSMAVVVEAGPCKVNRTLQACVVAAAAAAAAAVLHCSLGGLQEGLAVELANGSMAVVVDGRDLQIEA
jgi:hypothetical protein